MNFPDFSEYLKLPGKLENEERAWLANPHIHDRQAEIVNEVYKENKLRSVLEIGCGTGNLANRLKVKKYIGIDSNEAEIEIAKTKNPKYEFKCWDIRNIFGVKEMDVVCCFAFLKHFALHEWDEIFQRCASFGKYFIFSMSIDEETKDDGIDFHHVWKSIDGLNKSIYDAGLTLLKVYDEKSLEPIFICKKKD